MGSSRGILEMKLYFEEKGVGRPVLLLHGFGASLFTWRHVMEPLSADHRMIAVDLKGFGRSPKPRDNRYSILDQAELVRDLIRDMALEDITLVGHSYGGAVAMALAVELTRRSPGMLNRLVLIGAAVYPQKLPPFIKVLKTPGLARFGMGFISREKQVRMVLETCFHDPSRITEDMIKAYSQPLYEKGGGQAMISVAKQLIPANHNALIGQYSGIEVPALLIWGQFDRVVPIETAHRLEKDLPDARLELIADCGHIPQEEKPKETLEHLRAFLSQE